jgi:hypothetical protein
MSRKVARGQASRAILFYAAPAHERSQQRRENRKSVQAEPMLGHFSKSDVRYWQRAVFRLSYTVDGKRRLTKEWYAVSSVAVSGSSSLLGLRIRHPPLTSHSPVNGSSFVHTISEFLPPGFELTPVDSFRHWVVRRNETDIHRWAWRPGEAAAA